MFLKGNTRTGIKAEIDEYANIHINWIRGKKAVMTILDDNGKTLEEVALYKLKTREDMHKLMKEKGFVKKSQEQMVSEGQAELVKAELKQLETTSHLYSSVSSLYFVIFIVVTVGGAFVFNGRKRKRIRGARLGSSNAALLRV
mmetsp:Transcript_23066/g.50337  ORF Transcript_23066/g.50337 Transcript_23066/m.50337 type:complete len:143 (+) Transcript_23066:218-646(+)